MVVWSSCFKSEVLCHVSLKVLCLSPTVRFLSVLQIPMSDVTDQIVEKHAESFSTLTVLDISYCLKITSKGMEALGKHCKALVQLTRNMPPPEFETTQDDGVAAKVDEGEAMVIANNMAGLEHLELAYGKFSHHGLAAILTNCTALKILDVRGCWNVKMENNIEAMCAKIQSFRDPWEDDYEFSSSEDEGDNSSAKDVGPILYRRLAAQESREGPKQTNFHHCHQHLLHN
ncbi:hypothetical protein C4D60_Mb07t08620 [Musa balbisiana]|uniref:F-box domain-containing protein n=1 Tax=Musa balbisiana TaxID=52838 RepID=A0A4S8JDW1_MUSBA|nr:hypothetical protein C4D60_Mb07t08620 [Musa balbisiana]